MEKIVAVDKNGHAEIIQRKVATLNVQRSTFNVEVYLTGRDPGLMIGCPSLHSGQSDSSQAGKFASNMAA